MRNNKLKIFALASIMLSSFVACTTNNNNSQVGGNPSTGGNPISSVEEVEYTFNTYSNPLTVTRASGSTYTEEVADPTVVRGDDGLLYCVSTDRRMLSSEDGCNWTLVSDSIISLPQWGKEIYGNQNGHLWAPDLVKIQDKWIYYYSLSVWGQAAGIGYAVADDIAGPYTDMGKLFNLNEIGVGNCIDPQVFVDTDGSVYMTVGSFQGCYLIQLTDDGMACETSVEYQKEHKELIAGKGGPNWDGAQYEGGYIIEQDGLYYYFGSAGTCCQGQDSTYTVWVGIADNVHGPYVGKNGISMAMSGSGKTYGEIALWAGTAKDKDVVGPGHNSIFVDDAGDWWIYYHAYSRADNFQTRHLFMDKIAFDDQGYPHTSFVYEDDNGEEKTVIKKPSFQVELEGPRFIVE